MASSPTTTTNSKNDSVSLVEGGEKKNGVFVPTTTTPAAAPTLNSDTLQTSPYFQLKQPKPATDMAGLGGAIEAQTGAFTQGLKDKADEAAKVKDTALTAYIKSLGNTQGQASLTDTAYKTAVDPAEADLKDINGQIIAEQTGLTRRLEALDKNPQGLFGGALEQEKARISRDSIAKQADLSVIQLARQGKYDSAKAIADRAVTAKLENDRNVNEALKFNYQENKDLFTTEEQRAFESSLGDRNRALDKQEADLKQISDLSLNALQNGASTEVASQMRSAKTVEDAMAIGGQYVDRLDRQLKQAQLSKLNERPTADPIVKTINGVDAQWDGTKWVPIDIAGTASEAAITPLQEKANLIDSILKTGDYKHVVGTTGMGRTPIISGFTGQAQNAVAAIHQLTSQETLASLLNLKKAGGTLGALSDGERVVLQDAATKLAGWEIKDAKGNGTGRWDANEGDFKAELERIQKLTNKALVAALPKNFNVGPGDLLEIKGAMGETDQSTTPTAFSPSSYFKK